MSDAIRLVGISQRRTYLLWQTANATLSISGLISIPIPSGSHTRLEETRHIDCDGGRDLNEKSLFVEHSVPNNVWLDRWEKKVEK